MYHAGRSATHWDPHARTCMVSPTCEPHHSRRPARTWVITCVLDLARASSITTLITMPRSSRHHNKKPRLGVGIISDGCYCGNLREYIALRADRRICVAFAATPFHLTSLLGPTTHTQQHGPPVTVSGGNKLNGCAIESLVNVRHGDDGDLRLTVVNCSRALASRLKV